MTFCAICPAGIGQKAAVGAIDGIWLCGVHHRLAAMKRLGLTEADLTAQPKED